MNYSDSFRRAPSRRYSERAEDSYDIGPSHRYSADTSARTNYDDTTYRPGPSSAPPRRQDSHRETVDEEEVVVIQSAGPSMARPPDRRARVDDEPDILHVDPGPSSRPSGPDRSPIEVDIHRAPPVHERPALQRTYYIEDADDISIRRRPSGRGDVPLIIPRDDRRQAYGMPPPPPPPGSRYVPLDYAHDARRRSHGAPPPPPPYGLPIIEEWRNHRRQSHRNPSRPPPLHPRPPPRPVPPGVVHVSPYLDRPDLVIGHDLAILAEQPNPKDDERVRNNIVLCVYRHSKKAFDFRFVELRTSGHRLDRENKPAITDLQLFKRMRSTYQTDLRGWIRRFFSFKVLSTVRLLQYGDGLFFRPEQEDDIFSSKFMKIWRNPNEQLQGAQDRYEWNRWILQQKNLEYDFDMAIELIEDYVPDRIVFFVGLWLIGIAGLTAAWLIKGGDPGNVSTVMSFVLTFIAAVVALTGIWDWFDGDRSKEIQQRAVIVLPQEYKGHEPKRLPVFGPGPGQQKTEKFPVP